MTKITARIIKLNRFDAPKFLVYQCLMLLMLLFLLGCEEDKSWSEKEKSAVLSEIGQVSNNHTPVQDNSPASYKDTKFEIIDFTERDYKGVSSLAIVLSVPLDRREDIQSYFVLERRDGERVDGAWILAENGRELFFKNIEPETDYLLTVFANLKALNQQTLGKRYKKEIKTKSRVASVSFAHDGGILPLSHAKGLPVYSINIKQVDIEFHRVKNDRMVEFLESWRGGRRGAYQLQHYADKSQLVYSARFDMAIEKNKRERVNLEIDSIAELKPAGIYMAVMKPSGTYDYEQAVTYFVRSDIGLHVRRYPGKLDVYVRSIVTGAAMNDVSLSLLDKNSKILTVIQVDAQGSYSFSDHLKKAHSILAQKDQQMSLVQLHRPALDLSEFNVGQRIAQQNEAFIYAPRDLYRPGEKVEISMLLRDADGRSIPGISLPALIKQEDGQIVERFVWHAEKLGYYHHVLQLDKNDRTGLWHIEVQLPGNKSTEKWSFSVEDFLPERMKLSLSSAGDVEKQHFVVQEKNLIIAVEGQYLYGAPAAGNRLESRVRTVIDQHALQSQPDYFFGLAEEKGANDNYDLAEAQLDKQGKLNLKITPSWKNVQSPIVIKVSASLFETGGRAIERQTKFRLWPAKTLLGIRPHSDEPQADSLLKFDVINADKSGQLYSASDLQATLIKNRRDYYWTYNDSGHWQMDYSEKQYPVYKQVLSIKSAQKTVLEVPVEWGEYRLEIFNPQTKLTTSHVFNAGGSWYYDNEQAKITRPDKINLSLDKASYKAGDRVQLLIKSPFSGRGLVLVENNQGKLWQQEIELKNVNELQLSIPIAQHWQQHDIYISTILFNQSGENNVIKVKRAVGLIHLPLDRSQRQIQFSMVVPEKIKPLSSLEVELQLAASFLRRNNKITKVTLAAVDVGVLNVSGFSTPDAFKWFFSQRRYNVDSLDLYGNIMDASTGIVGQQRFGGDMDIASAGNLQKAKVKIVSLFQQPVTFNEQGIAIITLDIPDFNGQLRLMALAFNEDSYGQLEQAVTVASPLVSQLSMPRFLAANDESQLTLDVHNLSDEEQAIHLTLKADALLAISDDTRDLLLAPGEKQVLDFQITSHAVFGLANITLAINSKQSNEIAMQRQWQLAIRPAWPAIIRKQYKVIAPGESVILKLMTEDLMSETLLAKLIVSDQPPLKLATHLSHLLKYPYGCLEQTTSSTFPWLFVNASNLEKLGLNELKINNVRIDISQSKKYIKQGVQRLSAKQLTNGGFGLWNNHSSEEQWLTAYASHFLIQTRAQGHEVPKAVLKPALKRLQFYLRSTRPAYDSRFSDYPEHLSLAYKSYAAYVLSTLKQAPLGTMRTLYDYHAKDARSGLPLMHLGIALSRQGDHKRGDAAISKALSIQRDSHWYLGDYGSVLRDVSLMLEALIRFQPNHVGIEGLLIQLQDELTKRQYLSTQERNALFMTGIALMDNEQPSWQAILRLAMQDKNISASGDFLYTLNSDERSEIEQGIAVKSLSQSRLYSELELSAYTLESPQPDFSHFNINRTYYNTKGEMILPEQVGVGALIIVELSLQAKNRIQDALVVDLIPAGFEIENQNLLHSIKLDEFHINGQSLLDRVSSNHIKYQTWRDDRYVAAIDLPAHGTQHLYYLLRAVTPGEYNVPPPYAEDMYRPYIRAIGETPAAQRVINQNYKM